MTTKTKISWADEVWNPTTGCTRVSAGCKNCYAFTLHDQRHAVNLKVADEANMFPESFRDNGGALPMPRQYDKPFSTVQMHNDRLDSPLRKKAPKRIFVNSMSDLFHRDVPDEFIDRVFATMALAPQHTFQVLTKRPERMRAYLLDRDGLGIRSRQRIHAKAFDYCDPKHTFPWPKFLMPWPLPNVWLGVSVEDQETADERIPVLLDTPASVRWVSYEPALEAVDFTRYLDDPSEWASTPNPPIGTKLAWIVVGGESGNNSRPFDIGWARSVVAQCRAAGVPVFVKQMGSTPVYSDGESLYDRFQLKIHGHGSNPDEWPEDLRVQEWPR